MKAKKIHIGQIIAGILAAVLLPLATQISPAAAWGPADRPTYTNQKPADHPVFNSITNNAAVGDERDFVRIGEKGVGATAVSELEIEAGKEYEVWIYYHNDASETYNDDAHHNAGVAMDVRMSSSFPDELAAGQRGTVLGRITSTNTDPEAVWDEAYVTAREAMTLHYVTGSAKIYNSFAANGSVLSTNLFSNQGTFIGLDKLNGIILGCDKYSGQVVYTIRTVSVGDKTPDDVEPEPGTPEVPDDPEPTPENPPVTGVPEELPSTGPMEVTLAVIVVALIVAGVAYWWKTHKAVKKTKSSVKKKK